MEKFLKKQRETLVKERERLFAEMSRLEKYPDYGDMEDDNTNELQDYENNLSIDDQLKKLVIKVDKAIESIDNGTYGKCKICKNAIENERLEILPFAEICVSCKEKNEK